MGHLRHGHKDRDHPSIPLQNEEEAVQVAREYMRPLSAAYERGDGPLPASIQAQNQEMAERMASEYLRRIAEKQKEEVVQPDPGPTRSSG